MEGFCRGCLIKYDEPTDLLQYTEKNRRLYVYSTGLQVKRTDPIMFQVCKECYVNMKMSCKFKKQCRASDKRLKQYIAMKNTGDTSDFCTFLKNNDDSLTFRLPMLSGNSTPANQRNRDDDNESTCTSIRNFMTDILPPDEIPDAEARIIREVIAEEADVMDDSLDSHWLHDDASIDTDFRLDLSFSPFSTPRSGNNERFTLQRETTQDISNFANKIMQQTDNPTTENYDQIAIKTELDIKENDEEIESVIPVLDDIENHGINRGKFYIDNIESLIGANEEPIDNIDEKLEEALKEDGVKECLLRDIVRTPRVHPGVSGMSTPTINNILFGDKLDLDGVDGTFDEPNVGQCIENYDDIAGDIEIFNEFFYGTKQHDIDSDVEIEMETDPIFIKPSSPLKNQLPTKQIKHQSKLKAHLKTQLDFKDNCCKICDKKYKSARALKMHFARFHLIPGQSKSFNPILDAKDPFLMSKFDLKDNVCFVCDQTFDSTRALKGHVTKIHRVKIPQKEVPKTTRQKKICDYCGKSFASLSCLKKHIISHMDGVKQYICNYCNQQFGTESNFRMHMTTHLGQAALKPPKKLHICTVCGKSLSSGWNLSTHLRRHNQVFSHQCAECGKQFVRSSDLKGHLRRHNGERPFACTFCEKRFSRRDTLNVHIKTHTGEKRFKCDLCDKQFVRAINLKQHQKSSTACHRNRTNYEKVKPTKKAVKTNKKVNILYIIQDQNIKTAVPAIAKESTVPDMPDITEVSLPDITEENIGLPDMYVTDDSIGLPDFADGSISLPDITVQSVGSLDITEQGFGLPVITDENVGLQTEISISLPDITVQSVGSLDITEQGFGLPVITDENVGLQTEINISLPDITVQSVRSPDITEQIFDLPIIITDENIGLPDLTESNVSLPDMSVQSIGLPDLTDESVRLPDITECIDLPDIPEDIVALPDTQAKTYTLVNTKEDDASSDKIETSYALPDLKEINVLPQIKVRIIPKPDIRKERIIPDKRKENNVLPDFSRRSNALAGMRRSNNLPDRRGSILPNRNEKPKPRRPRTRLQELTQRPPNTSPDIKETALPDIKECNVLHGTKIKSNALPDLSDAISPDTRETNALPDLS